MWVERRSQGIKVKSWNGLEISRSGNYRNEHIPYREACLPYRCSLCNTPTVIAESKQGSRREADYIESKSVTVFELELCSTCHKCCEERG